VEQPELHVHPHHQMLLARAFAQAAQDKDGPMLIIETHSNHLIAEIGNLIARSSLDHAHTQVLCVEPHPDGGAKIRPAIYDEDGYLKNWPVGFMSP
jgi:predicted ATPase